MTTVADVPVIIHSAQSQSERRINASWTIAQLKSRLEPITGIPAGSQKLSLKIASQPTQLLEASNEETQQLAAWPLQPYAEIQVGGDSCCDACRGSRAPATTAGRLLPLPTQTHRIVLANALTQVLDTRPPGARENYTDTSNVEKFVLPVEEYEARKDSVLAWKKAQKLGRFDPNAPHILQEKANASFAEVEQRGETCVPGPEPSLTCDSYKTRCSMSPFACFRSSQRHRGIRWRSC